ncbi:MAG: tetratricopeptide repeat protein [Treponema sp.]|jgi:tetratricopeptide (TPR) repeat protein|nr:tetratricopeptide repeat protein [Treponema sp.]
MKKVKEIILGILIVLALGILVMLVYRNEKAKIHQDLAKRIAELSPRGGPPETIEGLRKAIALYEAQIELNIREGAQTGVYWKILATRLAERNMHRDALDALEQALRFNAEDPTLYYLIGVSSGIVAKSIIGFSADTGTERERFFTLSENSYLRAIELDPDYPKPRYGLGILYTFELDRPTEAIPHLIRYLEIISSDIQVMFVLARAYYMTENYDQAIELYDQIIARSKDPKVKVEAQNNKEIIRGQLYG